MEFCRAKSYAIMKAFSYCSLAIFHTGSDFCKQDIIFGKVCETRLDLIILFDRSRVDLTPLGYSGHGYKGNLCATNKPRIVALFRIDATNTSKRY